MQKGYSGPCGIEQFVVDRSVIDLYLIDNLFIEKKYIVGVVYDLH